MSRSGVLRLPPGSGRGVVEPGGAGGGVTQLLQQVLGAALEGGPGGTVRSRVEQGLGGFPVQGVVVLAHGSLQCRGLFCGGVQELSSLV